MDCTEQPIQRPGADAVQRAHCSGNPRHTHHTKTSIIAGLVNIEAEFSLL